MNNKKDLISSLNEFKIIASIQVFISRSFNASQQFVISPDSLNDYVFWHKPTRLKAIRERTIVANPALTNQVEIVIIHFTDIFRLFIQQKPFSMKTIV
jgi:hypothetical protein